jgi:hypothetical protein
LKEGESIVCGEKGTGCEYCPLFWITRKMKDELSSLVSKIKKSEK